ncbi:MAG: L,D-transpeptidase [Negativicutes bacterium]|nr:L,D-transpeptidase [Negativicutes bacterium]
MRILCSLIVIYFIALSSALASPEIHINIPAYALNLIDNGQIVKTYSIAVGTPYEQTPTGSFQIFMKQEYPTWYPGTNFTDRTPVPPGPENPLGSRWMEFSPNYGIHGTNKGWDISYPVSGGCIRMQDADARELYDKVPLGTPVIIRYQTMEIVEKADGLYLKIYPDIYRRQTNNAEQLSLLLAPYTKRYEIVNGAAIDFSADLEDVREIKLGTLRQLQPLPLPGAKTAQTKPPLAPPGNKNKKRAS